MEEKIDLKSHILRYSLILGVVSGVFIILLYLIDYNLMLNYWVSALPMVLWIGLPIYAGIALRKQNGGLLPFKTAFVSSFAIIAIGVIVSTLFNVLLYQVIDPELPAKMQALMIEKQTAMLEGFGMEQDQIDAQMAKLEEDPMFSLGKQLTTGLMTALIGGAIFALITGAIVKKNPTEIEVH